MVARGFNHLARWFTLSLSLGSSLACPFPTVATETDGPEKILRALVHANAERDLATLSALMAHDADIVGYTVGGRKYVGWEKFLADMKEEFDSVSKLEIPITELKVWTRSNVAWFTMELDYIRYVVWCPRLPI